MRRGLLYAGAALAGAYIVARTRPCPLIESDEVPELDPDLLYEECPDCPPDGFCMTCWDHCLVPHDC